MNPTTMYLLIKIARETAEQEERMLQQMSPIQRELYIRRMIEREKEFNREMNMTTIFLFISIAIITAIAVICILFKIKL